MDYPLENLGAQRFQMLCQALLVKEYKDITCYPVGMPDGGRDATQQHLQDPSETFTVFQVKFAEAPPPDKRKWLTNAISGEIKKVNRLIERGATNYVFITNVSGTSHLDVGTMDQLQAELQALVPIPVKWWWRDDINRRLDTSWNIKLKYPEVLTGSDYLRILIENQKNDDHKRRLNALRAFLVAQFDDDREVKFKQVELQNKLLDLFVDLPIRSGKFQRAPSKKSIFLNKNEPLISDGLDNNSTLASPNTAASVILHRNSSKNHNQLVIEGAPGQGKSTLAQYLCQVHRIKILNKSDEYSQIPANHQLAPVKLPIKVDLRDLAEWLSGQNPFSIGQDSTTPTERSVETFLAHLISTRAGGIAFSVNDLIEASQIIPLFIAFDGLDEVADIRRRAEVVAQVTKRH